MVEKKVLTGLAAGLLVLGLFVVAAVPVQNDASGKPGGDSTTTLLQQILSQVTGMASGNSTVNVDDKQLAGINENIISLKASVDSIASKDFSVNVTNVLPQKECNWEKVNQVITIGRSFNTYGNYEFIEYIGLPLDLPYSDFQPILSKADLYTGLLSKEEGFCEIRANGIPVWGIYSPRAEEHGALAVCENGICSYNNVTIPTSSINSDYFQVQPPVPMSNIGFVGGINKITVVGYDCAIILNKMYFESEIIPANC